MLNTAATHMLRTLSGNLHVVYVCLCVLRATASTAVVHYLVHQRLGPLFTSCMWPIPPGLDVAPAYLDYNAGCGGIVKTHWNCIIDGHDMILSAHHQINSFLEMCS